MEVFGAVEQESPVALAAIIRARRQHQGMTQQQLAARAGLSVGALRDIEQGRTTSPRGESLAGLASALGADSDELAQLISRYGQSDVGSELQGGLGSVRKGLHIAILGPLTLSRDGAVCPLGPVRQRAVLALLALHSHGLSGPAIVNSLWGQNPPDAAISMVQGYISRLRRIGELSRDPTARDDRGGGIVLRDGARYRLASEVRSDRDDFADLTTRARRAMDAGRTGDACGLFRQSLSLWRGEALADLDILASHPAVTELSTQRVEVVVEFSDAAIAAGAARMALEQLRAAASVEPLDERIHGRLMAALAASGQQATALTLFQDIRARLDRELGIRPGQELQDMHVRVLRQEISKPAQIGLMTPNRPQPDLEAGPADTSDDWGPEAGSALSTGAPQELPPVGDGFVGRAAELKVLDSLLHRPQAHPGMAIVAAISGTAGVGKTTLAVYWAHKVASRFPNGTLYANLRGFGPGSDPTSAEEVLLRFLEALGVPAHQIPVRLEARAALYRTVLSSRQMLIVIDNARDAAQVRPLLPGSSGCVAVVTSRGRLSGLAVAEAAVPIALDVLPQADAGELLELRLGKQRVWDEPEAAKVLISQCARLPLALSVTAARAAEFPRRSLASVASELDDERQRLDFLETDDPACGVRTALSWSYESLSEPAARVFRLSAVHPGPDLTAPAAASLAGIPLALARRVLGELVRASLMTEQDAGRLACHDLLRTYAAELSQALDTQAARLEALERVLDHYLHACASLSELVAPRRLASLKAPAEGVHLESFSDYGRGLKWLRVERQVLLSAVERAKQSGFDTHVWQLGWAMDYPFLGQSWLHDLLTVQQAALRAADRLGDRTARAHALHALGHVLIVLGQHGEACLHLRKAAVIFAELGDERSRALVHHHLAAAFAETGQYRDAIEQAHKARRLLKAVGEDAVAAGALNNIGWCLLQLGEHDRALAFIRKSVWSFHEMDDHHGEAVAMSSLGWTHHQLGSESLAVTCLTKALVAVQEPGGGRLEAEIRANLGDIYHATGRKEEAEHEWALALSMLEDGSVTAGRLRAKINGISLTGQVSAPPVDGRQQPPRLANMAATLIDQHPAFADRAARNVPC